MKSRVILSHRERKDNNKGIFCSYTQLETMERKPFEVDTTTDDHKPYSAVDGRGADVTSNVDSFEEDQEKLVYRGWKVMPFIIDFSDGPKTKI
ncbi:unnamed protein product [Microthlaspi erraticum]|uniref:Uncharacterized protein n=1 Tax=Microthlaspi erraticum TaxID=1685480 RepID=A0A6D2JNU8_9BRAS|nr:unnamed protein product [Microthlaspi erraticum]